MLTADASHYGRQNVTQPFPSDLQVDQIYHLACPASPKRFPENPLGILDTCFEGTKNALELAKKCNARILLASTSGKNPIPDSTRQRRAFPKIKTHTFWPISQKSTATRSPAPSPNPTGATSTPSAPAHATTKASESPKPSPTPTVCSTRLRSASCASSTRSARASAPMTAASSQTSSPQHCKGKI